MATPAEALEYYDRAIDRVHRPLALLRDPRVYLGPLQEPAQRYLDKLQNLRAAVLQMIGSDNRGH